MRVPVDRIQREYPAGSRPAKHGGVQDPVILAARIADILWGLRRTFLTFDYLPTAVRDCVGGTGMVRFGCWARRSPGYAPQAGSCFRGRRHRPCTIPRDGFFPTTFGLHPLPKPSSLLGNPPSARIRPPGRAVPSDSNKWPCAQTAPRRGARSPAISLLRVVSSRHSRTRLTVLEALLKEDRYA